jgi:cytochrome d ubiquinol oxidase subunit I
MWETQPAPAGLTVIGVPDVEARKTHFEVHLPWVLGVIATRSFDGQVLGINDLVRTAEIRIKRGILAYDAVETLKREPGNIEAREQFEQHRADFGHALLLKRFVADPRMAGADDIAAAARSTIPNVPVMFFLFRGMAGLGFLFIGFFAFAFWRASRNDFRPGRFLKLAVLMIPLPWLAAELGWMLAELGRQPWSVEGQLPTFLAASSLTIGQIWTTLIGFTLLYGTLAVIMVRLMLKAIRKGPEPVAPALPEANPGLIPLPAE